MATEASEGARIVAFYEGAAPDDQGRFLEEILRFSDDRLESVHDFIQWLFPLRERSGANPDAPVLDDRAVAEFHNRKELRTTMLLALSRMLEFYGLKWSGTSITKAPSFEKRAQWLTPGNHNYLRLTRMLKSLNTLGSEEAAQALFACLVSIYREEQDSSRSRISERTFEFWSAAAKHRP